MDRRTDSAASIEADKYYDQVLESPTANDAFENLDDPKVMHGALQAVSSSFTRNFLLDFSDDHARVGFDLQATTVTDLLSAGTRPDELNTRWINVWYPFQQKPLLERLAKHFDFSPRLLAMMTSDPRRVKSDTPLPSRPLTLASQRTLSEVERGLETQDVQSISSNNPARTGNIYDIADEVWHYTSVDQGRNYICLGYNSIYHIGNNLELTPGSHTGTSKPPLPGCKRVWTWLLLCANRTIIMVNEDPFPFSEGSRSRQEQEVLHVTRRNLVNVFRSLSHVEQPESASPLTLLPIRKRLGSSAEETVHRASDAPGLLFYYLFENWFNSYSLVTRRDSRYGLELDAIRSEMFEQPQLRHINRLDQVGNQLGVLKRHYKSYIRIIDRVIEPQTATLASLNNSEIATQSSQIGLIEDGEHGFKTVMTEEASMLGISLSQASRVRFERLKDLIHLYALSEVKDYLAQKDSLVQMNFQLIAIKESRDVERLTRVSLLVTKATILFLPVSLMTAYFSTDLANTSYTVATYWIAFSIMFAISWFALLGFGVVSGSMESWAFFPPLKQLAQRICGRRKLVRSPSAVSA